MRRDRRIAMLIVLAAVLLAAVGVALPALSHEYPADVRGIVDADTLDAEFIFPAHYDRIRLYCIDAPESFGAEKSQEGVASADAVKELRLRRVYIEVVDEDAFGRLLAWVRPRGWEMTLNKWLYLKGAPLYDKLTRAERAECLERLEG